MTKTMTCKQMGGPCDTAITAENFDEATQKGMEHIEAAHPEMATDIKAMTQPEMETWATKARADWDALPEDAAPAAPMAA